MLKVIFLLNLCCQGKACECKLLHWKFSNKWYDWPWQDYVQKAENLTWPDDVLSNKGMLFFSNFTIDFLPKGWKSRWSMFTTENNWYVQPSLLIPTVLTVLNLVYLAKIIVYSMASDGIPVSALKCLVTRYWHKHLIKINPRDLWKSLGHNSSFVALDLPLRAEFCFENPFTAYHLLSDWPWYSAEKILPHKLFEFLCTCSFPVPSIPSRYRIFIGSWVLQNFDGPVHPFEASRTILSHIRVLEKHLSSSQAGAHLSLCDWHLLVGWLSFLSSTLAGSTFSFLLTSTSTLVRSLSSWGPIISFKVGASSSFSWFLLISIQTRSGHWGSSRNVMSCDLYSQRWFQLSAMT